MHYFLGSHDYNLDAQNRLSVPSKFRKVMAQLKQTNFIVSKDQENYLTIYPYIKWKERIGDKISELAHSDESANRLRRLIGLNTTEVQLDSHGRINIPIEYYEHAEIKKNVRIIGAVDTIQLWNPGSYEIFADKMDEKNLLQEAERFGI